MVRPTTGDSPLRRCLVRHLTVMSIKGQVVVPADIRSQLQWGAGTRLLVQWSKGSQRLVLTPISSPTSPVSLTPAGVLRDAYPLSSQYV